MGYLADIYIIKKTRSKQKIHTLTIILLLISCNKGVQKNNSEHKTESKITKERMNKIHSTTSEEKIKAEKKDTITIEYLNKNFAYDFDTKLSNGYSIEFSYFKNNKDNFIEKCLTLKKKNKIIDTLNIMGYGAPDKNLGYIGADFKHYFAFVNSFGSGNPHEFRLIKKINGETIKEGYIIDSFNNPDFLLYIKGHDSIMLYDVTKKKDKLIEHLSKSNEIKGTLSNLCDILKIKKVTKEYVQIEIDNYDTNKLTKKYYR